MAQQLLLDFRFLTKYNYFYYLYLKQTALCVATLGGSQIPALQCTPPTRMSLHICADPARTSGRRETRRQHHEGTSAAAQVHQHVIRTQVPQSLPQGFQGE